MFSFPFELTWVNKGRLFLALLLGGFAVFGVYSIFHPHHGKPPTIPSYETPVCVEAEHQVVVDDTDDIYAVSKVPSRKVEKLLPRYVMPASSPALAKKNEGGTDSAQSLSGDASGSADLPEKTSPRGDSLENKKTEKRRDHMPGEQESSSHKAAPEKKMGTDQQGAGRGDTEDVEHPKEKNASQNGLNKPSLEDKRKRELSDVSEKEDQEKSKAKRSFLEKGAAGVEKPAVLLKIADTFTTLDEAREVVSSLKNLGPKCVFKIQKSKKEGQALFRVILTVPKKEASSVIQSIKKQGVSCVALPSHSVGR